MARLDGAHAMFEKTYQEALGLTREARDYVAVQERRDQSSLVPLDQLTASCESMRVTARLTQVMAWLLVQKAVHQGEMTREQAADPELRLAGQHICGVSNQQVNETLPPRLRDLLERSHQLYRRIERLDALMDG
jgi:regulator of CtrA degradation